MDNKKFCSNCGKEIDPKAEICPKCGVRVYKAKEGKSKTTAGILAMFLGGIGIHKFYLGKDWQGLLYLLFCWTYIPAIIGFIEGIVYLTMSDNEFEVRYG